MRSPALFSKAGEREARVFYEFVREPKGKSRPDVYPVYIYVLVDPRDESFRYVGKAIDLAQRLGAHIIDGKRWDPRLYDLTPRMAWLGELAVEGLSPRMFVLEHATNLTADEAELRWFAHFFKEGADLLNGAWRGWKWELLQSWGIDLPRWGWSRGATVNG